jgi:hypothetical protein
MLKPRRLTNLRDQTGGYSNSLFNIQAVRQRRFTQEAVIGQKEVWEALISVTG